MSNRLFVGNLPYSATETELRDLFVGAGLRVSDVVIVNDRETGRGRGFGFVELGTTDEARSAIELLDGATISGRILRINEAHERTPRSSPPQAPAESSRGYGGRGKGHGRRHRDEGRGFEEW